MAAVGIRLEIQEAAAKSRFWTASWGARVAFGVAAAVFLLGFVLGLDPGGGSRSDFYTYHLPAILAFRHGAFSAVLRDYSSATTPLFHILASYNPLLGSDTAFRASSLCFSLVVCGLFMLFFLFIDRRLVQPFVSMRTGWAMFVFALALLGGASLYHGKDSGSYPIYSKHRPWEGLPPRAAFADGLVLGQPIP